MKMNFLLHKNRYSPSSTVATHAKIEVEHEDGPLKKPRTNKSTVEPGRKQEEKH